MWMLGRSASLMQSMNWYVQLHGSRIYHRCVLEGGGKHRFFMSSCGFTKGVERVRVMPADHGAPEPKGPIRRCRNCYWPNGPRV